MVLKRKELMKLHHVKCEFNSFPEWDECNFIRSNLKLANLINGHKETFNVSAGSHSCSALPD